MVFWKAFAELSSSRVISQAGPCGIPLSEILSWLDMRGIVEDTDARIDYVFLVQQLDTEFLSFSSERMQEQQERSRSKVQAAKSKHPARR